MDFFKSWFPIGERNGSITREDIRTKNRGSPLIVVLGTTGSGKTTFIKELTGRSDVHASNSLGIGTRQISEYPLVSNGETIVLLDTPGFDNILQTDLDIVGDLREYLEEHHQGRHLDAIVYLHNISVPRLAGSSKASLGAFRQICGDTTSFVQTAVLTTFWDKVKPEVGERRQAELCETSSVLLDLLKDGATLMAMPQTRLDRKKLMVYLLDNGNGQRVSSGHPAASLTDSQGAEVEAQRVLPLRTSNATAQFSDSLETKEMSLRVRAHLVTAQEDDLAKREAALTLKEKMLDDAGKRDRDAMNDLRMQFETRLSFQTTLSELALTRAMERYDGLEESLDSILKMHQGHVELIAQKDRDIANLRCAQTQTYLSGQASVFNKNSIREITSQAEASGSTGHQVNVRPAASAMLNRCDACREAKSGEWYICDTAECSAKTCDHLGNFRSTSNFTYGLCETCYSGGQTCPGRHVLTPLGASTDVLPNCKFRPNTAGIRCSICFEKTYGSFIHCCSCDKDKFFLCGGCYLSRISRKSLCRDSKHNLVLGFVCLPA